MAAETSLPLEQRFNFLLSKWGQLVEEEANFNYSTDVRDYIKFGEYYELVSLGKSIIPFVFKEIQSEKERVSPFLLAKLISDIPGTEFSPPKSEDVFGSIKTHEKMRSYLNDWFYTRGDLIL